MAELRVQFKAGAAVRAIGAHQIDANGSPGQVEGAGVQLQIGSVALVPQIHTRSQPALHHPLQRKAGQALQFQVAELESGFQTVRRQVVDSVALQLGLQTVQPQRIKPDLLRVYHGGGDQFQQAQIRMGTVALNLDLQVRRFQPSLQRHLHPGSKGIGPEGGFERKIHRHSPGQPQAALSLQLSAEHLVVQGGPQLLRLHLLPAENQATLQENLAPGAATPLQPIFGLSQRQHSEGVANGLVVGFQIHHLQPAAVRPFPLKTTLVDDHFGKVRQGKKPRRSIGNRGLARTRGGSRQQADSGTRQLNRV